MNRPLELTLLPNEVYPGDRNINDNSKETTVIQDMSQMAEYVYQYYMRKVNTMKSEMVIILL